MIVETLASRKFLCIIGSLKGGISLELYKNKRTFHEWCCSEKTISSENGQKYLSNIICTVLNMPEDSLSFKVIHPDSWSQLLQFKDSSK